LEIRRLFVYKNRSEGKLKDHNQLLNSRRHGILKRQVRGKKTEAGQKKEKRGYRLITFVFKTEPGGGTRRGPEWSLENQTLKFREKKDCNQIWGKHRWCKDQVLFRQLGVLGGNRTYALGIVREPCNWVENVPRHWV